MKQSDYWSKIRGKQKHFDYWMKFISKKEIHHFGFKQRKIFNQKFTNILFEIDWNSIYFSFI